MSRRVVLCATSVTKLLRRVELQLKYVTARHKECIMEECATKRHYDITKSLKVDYERGNYYISD